MLHTSATGCSTSSSLTSQFKMCSKRMAGKHSPILSPKHLPSIEGSAWITSTPCWKQKQQLHPCSPKALIILTGTQHRHVTVLSLIGICLSNTSDIIVVLGGETGLFKKGKNNAIDGLFTESQMISNTKRYCLTKVRSVKATFKRQRNPHFMTKQVPAHLSVVQDQCFHVLEPDIPQ